VIQLYSSLLIREIAEGRRFTEQESQTLGCMVAGEPNTPSQYRLVFDQRALQVIDPFG
jgi:hypothetical protein